MPQTITVITYSDLVRYAASIRLLEMDEAENSLLLGTVEPLKHKAPPSPPFTAEVKRGAETIAAGFYNERNLVVTRNLEQAVEAIATKLIENHIDVPGVVGPSAVSEKFAET